MTDGHPTTLTQIKQIENISTNSKINILVRNKQKNILVKRDINYFLPFTIIFSVRTKVSWSTIDKVLMGEHKETIRRKTYEISLHKEIKNTISPTSVK